jgi:mono/diheme cytochrome c family protein
LRSKNRALILGKVSANAARHNGHGHTHNGMGSAPDSRRSWRVAARSKEVMTMAKAKSSMEALRPGFGRASAAGRALLYGGAFTSALLLAGCAVEVQNTQPAQELAQLAKPPGSVYTGWRVFQDRCAACHGSAGSGGTGGPDLLPRVREMGSRQFVGLVLQRYDWGLSPAQAGSQSAAREALIDEMVQRKQGMLTMPAWQGEPRVSAHIVDLYAYVSARAQGTQGPGRPVQ